MSSVRGKNLKKMPSIIEISQLRLNRPIFQGHVFKQSHIFTTSFNKRYFVLYNGCLVYYNHRSDYESDVKAGHLKNRLGYYVMNRVYLSKPDKKPLGGKYCFILHTPDPANKRKQMLLVTQTREERRDWMNCLQDQNPNLVTPESIVRPDTPVVPRKNSENNHDTTAEDNIEELHVPSSDINRNPSFDSLALNVAEGDSDTENHEPDDFYLSKDDTYDDDDGGIELQVTDDGISVTVPSITIH
jgi:hypothetical protein